jgi:hypothetical protein
MQQTIHCSTTTHGFRKSMLFSQGIKPSYQLSPYACTRQRHATRNLSKSNPSKLIATFLPSSKNLRIWSPEQTRHSPRFLTFSDKWCGRYKWQKSGLEVSMLAYVKFEIISVECGVQQKGVGVRKFGTDDGDDEVGQTYFAHDRREVPCRSPRS